jgi:predicted ATP-grasp superfamily ATP-dependent carboligase
VKPTVLLVSTATRWYGTARMPRVFANAGFEVVLLAPTGSLAAKSRYVSRIVSISANAIPMELLVALIRAVDDVSPRVLIPCDEMAVRLLFALRLKPPAGLDSATNSRLVALMNRSLGDAEFFSASIDKTLLPAAAQSLGVRVPPYAVVTRAHDAIEHGSSLGYPLVVKRRFGFAGQGVAIASSRDELIGACERLLRPDQLDIGENHSPQLLIQKFIVGPHHSQALVALDGVPLAGFAWERASASDPVKGQTVLLRFVHSPQTRAYSEGLCRGFGMSGLFNMQYLIDAATGEAHLLEINRRIVTHMHLGERVGIDLAQALRRGLDGEIPASALAPDATTAASITIFPREWLRNPASPYLTDHPVDVPWDEPELLAAMLAMRHEG